VKILLVNTNRYKLLCSPPIGLAYLVPFLKEGGHKIELLDLKFSSRPLDDIENVINNIKPDIAGISIRLLNNYDMTNIVNPLPEIKKYVELIYSRNIITVLGGTAFSILPQEILRYMKADYGIIGQGEKSFRQLVDSLSLHEDFSFISGLVWRKNGIITENPIVNDGLNNDVIPDWSCINLRKHVAILSFVGAGSVVTKIGCPNNCIYCIDPYLLGKKQRFRQFETIIKEIKIIKKVHKVNLIHFADTCFNIPLDWAKRLLKTIIDHKLNIHFSSAVVPTNNHFDEEFFELYKKAGGQMVVIGTESFSSTMLRNYRKPFCINDIEHCGKLANKYKIPFFIELLIGGPGENEHTVKESMAFLEYIDYSFIVYGIGVRITPHTEIYKIAKKDDLIKDQDELIYPKFYVSKELDIQWAKHYIDKSLKKYNYRNIRMLPILVRNVLGRYFNIFY